MTALVSLRAGLRGARPRAARRRDARRRGRCPRAPCASSSTTSSFRYPSADEVSLASLEAVGHRRPTRAAAGAARRAPSPSSPGSWSRWSARPAPARPPSPRWWRGCTTSRPAPSGSAGSTCATSRSESLRDAVGVVTQDAHLFHDTIRANLAYAPADGHRGRAWSRRCGPPRSGTLVDSLPDGLDTVVGDRGYRLSGGEKQRLAIARLLLKAPGAGRPRRGHGPPRHRVRGGAVQRALDHALRGRYVARHRAPAVARSATPTRSSSSTAAPSSSAAPTTSWSPRAGCTPSSTAPSSAMTSAASSTPTPDPVRSTAHVRSVRVR